MPTSSKPRTRQTKPTRQMGENIATLQAQVQSLLERMETTEHQLMGNGKPGLMTQVPALLMTQEQHSKMLEGMLDSLQEMAVTQRETHETLKDLHAEVTSQLQAQKATMDQHLAPGNPQHETLAKTWREKPVQTMLAIITIFTVLSTLTPYLTQLVVWLNALVH